MARAASFAHRPRMRFPAPGHRAIHAVEFRGFGWLPDTACRFVALDPVIFTVPFSLAAFLRTALAKISTPRSATACGLAHDAGPAFKEPIDSGLSSKGLDWKGGR